jgi:hypothetical protein
MPPVPMSPLKLTDDELDAVLAAARPLDVGDRDAFLQAVAAALQSEGKIGPGVVRRVTAPSCSGSSSTLPTSRASPGVRSNVERRKRPLDVAVLRRL